MITDDTNAGIRTAAKINVKRAVQNLIDIYQDAWEYIIYDELAKQFTPQTYADMYWLVTTELNPLKSIINEISLIYKDPAIRKCTVKGTEKDADGNEIDVPVSVENYDLALENSDIDSIMPSINTYTNLCNHTLQRVKWNGEEKRIAYELINFNNAEIYSNPDDWQRMDAVKYYTGLSLPSGSVSYEEPYKTGPQPAYDVTTYKTQDYYRAYIHTGGKPGDTIKHPGIIENGNNVTLEAGKVYTLVCEKGNEIIIGVEDNPYMDGSGNFVLPFVLWNKDYPIDRLLNFSQGSDLVAGTVNAAINMVHLNMLEKYQSYKNIVFKVDDITKFPDKIKVDPTSLVIIEAPEGRNVGAEVLDLQANIDVFWSNIQARLQQLALTYNVSPQNFTVSGSAASGISQMVSNQGKMEAREQQIQAYRSGERKLYEVTKAVWNYHNPTKEIPEDAVFTVDFAEIEFPKTADEQIKEDEFYKAHNIITDIDIMIRENPDLTPEQAEAKLKENQNINEVNRDFIDNEIDQFAQGAINENI